MAIFDRLYTLADKFDPKRLAAGTLKDMGNAIDTQSESYGNVIDGDRAVLTIPPSGWFANCRSSVAMSNTSDYVIQVSGSSDNSTFMPMARATVKASELGGGFGVSIPLPTGDVPRYVKAQIAASEASNNEAGRVTVFLTWLPIYNAIYPDSIR